MARGRKLSKTDTEKEQREHDEILDKYLNAQIRYFKNDDDESFEEYRKWSRIYREKYDA